ncbi:MAG: hypothetical protein AAGI37_14135 [Planctomycetota bacterium]
MSSTTQPLTEPEAPPETSPETPPEVIKVYFQNREHFHEELVAIFPGDQYPSLLIEQELERLAASQSTTVCKVIEVGRSINDLDQ